MKVSAQGLEQYKAYVSKLKNNQATTAKGGAKADAAKNTDKVDISSEASSRAELSRFAAMLAGEVEDMGRADRIAALRDAVQSGSYSVSAEDVADSILND